MRTRHVAALAAGALAVASLATVATYAAGGEPEPLRTPSTERTESSSKNSTRSQADPRKRGGGWGEAPEFTSGARGGRRPAPAGWSRPVDCSTGLERKPPAEATTRPRVPPGVLARAASRRAQQREAESPPAPERRRGREGNIISVEIDWNAGTAER